MINRIRLSDLDGLNKGRGLKFCVGSQVRQETPEEGRRTYQPKCCEYNNKDKDNSPKTLNDKISFHSYLKNDIQHKFTLQKMIIQLQIGLEIALFFKRKYSKCIALIKILLCRAIF